MEPKFQTSFIPKKQIFPPMGGIGGGNIQKPKIHGASLFMAFAVIIFVVSIGGAAGSYFWKVYLNSINTSYKTELAKKETEFKLDVIERLKQINLQIDTGRDLLNKHVAMSKAFEVLQNITIEKVRFLSMDFKGPPSSGGNLTVNLKGYGSNLAAVAFQSDVLGKLSDLGLSKVVKNPIVSDPTLDANGSVSFGFTAEIDGASMSYIDKPAGSYGNNASTTKSVTQ